MFRALILCLALSAGCLPTNVKGARSQEQVAACRKAGSDGRLWQIATSSAALVAGSASIASAVVDKPEVQWGAAGAGLLAVSAAFYAALRGEHAARTARDCWDGYGQ